MRTLTTIAMAEKNFATYDSIMRDLREGRYAPDVHTDGRGVLLHRQDIIVHRGQRPCARGTRLQPVCRFRLRCAGKPDSRHGAPLPHDGRKAGGHREGGAEHKELGTPGTLR